MNWENCHTIISVYIIFTIYGNILRTLIKYHLQEVNSKKPVTRGWMAEAYSPENIGVMDKFNFK